jgi:hypothetical protein
LFVPGNLLGNLLNEGIVDFLIGQLFGGRWRGGWRRLLRRSLVRPAFPSSQDHHQDRYHAYYPTAFHIALPTNSERENARATRNVSGNCTLGECLDSLLRKFSSKFPLNPRHPRPLSSVFLLT